MSRALSLPNLIALLVGLGTACGISPTDPLPGIGAPCVVAKGRCDIEHVCRPDAAGDEAGVCAPVLSYGACNDKEPITHPPGRSGSDEERVINIEGPEGLPLLENVRSTTGQVRVFKQGADNVQLGDLCAFRDLQQVGDGLAVGDSDIQTLDGLQSITSVAGALAIFDNPDLIDLSGLTNLVHLTSRQVSTFASFDVVIASNRGLDDEDVDSFIAALETRTGRALSVVACGNKGRVCDAADQRVLDFLVVNGLGQ